MSNQQNDIPQDGAILHGEAILFRSQVPKDASPMVNPNAAKGYVVIADSETTGNHHVVHTPKGTEIFKSKDDRIFIVNTTETSVSCLHADRHSPIAIPPGTWEVGVQKEFDHAAQHLRNVQD